MPRAICSWGKPAVAAVDPVLVLATLFCHGSDAAVLLDGNGAGVKGALAPKSAGEPRSEDRPGPGKLCQRAASRCRAKSCSILRSYSLIAAASGSNWRASIWTCTLAGSTRAGSVESGIVCGMEAWRSLARSGKNFRGLAVAGRGRRVDRIEGNKLRGSQPAGERAFCILQDRTRPATEPLEGHKTFGGTVL